ncbi:MAG: L-rhamnose isomerase [Chthoniobacter sp.]|nr:L-rhamnose isomerase [Chthoniobacter sp.]
MSTTAYTFAREAYAEQGVDPEAALETLARTPLSLHCWQGDDVRGFEAGAGEPGGGLAVTGAYPGRARTPEELRTDLDQALALLPGRHRLNLHASYAELGGVKVDRDAYEAAHFRGWIEWAKARGLGLDFNPTFFGHPLAQSGLTLTHPDEGVRRFWIAHGIACRRIAAEMGRQLGSATMTNVWIPDGSKDLPVDRRGPRERLAQALDTVFAEAIDPALAIDAVESKLFGLGSEAYVAGSHEFYLGYAITRQKHLCLDAGHFHPTESIADKISSVLQFVPGLLLHVSRGVRWDSDHVVLQDDATQAIFQELVRGEYLGRTRVGLDYFDASINRVAAWVIGARAALKALLGALLEPTAKLRELEAAGDFTARLALLEEARTLPLGAVWAEHCRRHEVPAGLEWLREIHRYEREVLAHRR